MKSFALLAIIPLALGVVLPRDGTLSADNLPNGRYVTTVLADGTEHTTFTPWEEINNSGFAPVAINVTAATSSVSRREAAALDKRNGCEGYILNDSDVDKANQCVLSFSSLDPVLLGTNQKVSCVYGIAKSYICAYSSGSKSKYEIQFSWNYIRNPQCGPQRAGWNTVNGGSGNWDAGYTLNNAGFCGF